MIGHDDNELHRTVGDLSRAMSEMQRTVGRIEGKLDAFIPQMAYQDTRTTNLEVRTRRVENKQHWYAGIGTALGALVGAFGSHVGIKW